jgi:hypothetical protein
MFTRDLIRILREDFLDDNNSRKYLWDDPSLLRRLTEAEKQVCNRVDVLFDDSTPRYCHIVLVEGVASYDLSHKLTRLEKVVFDSNILVKTTNDDLDIEQPTWRTDTKLTDNTVKFVVRGRKIRFNRVPDATDAGKIVYLEVYRLPDQEIRSENQTFEIPEENHRDLIWWVLHECYKKQDADTFDQEKANQHLERFNEVFGEPIPANVRQHQFESPESLHILPTPYITKRAHGVSSDPDIWD